MMRASLSVSLVLVVGAPIVGAQGTGEVGAPWLVTPQRRALTLPLAVPALPAVVASVPPFTLAVAQRPVRDGRPGEPIVRRVFSRTNERVHVAESPDLEWLFQRNPRDPARVHGTRIDHRAKTLVFYDESDVRNLLGLAGWGSLVSLGFDHAQLDRATPTIEERRIGDVRFRRHANPGEEFWWSAETGLASHFVRSLEGGPVQVVLEAATAGVNEPLIRDPATRFPTYRQLDVADWLEHPDRHGSR